jgi:hypothetical protein
MTSVSHGESNSNLRIILVPGLITLAVTLLRLAGELAAGPRAWFNPEQGGAWAIVGIVWLVPIFGVYFALKQAQKGDRPGSIGRAIGLAAAGFVVFALGFYLYNAGYVRGFAGLGLLWGLAVAGAAIVLPAWPGLFKVLLAYGYAARVPVAVVMLIATWANWQTHYSTAFPGESKVETYFLFAFVPQLVWWVSFTVVVGSLVGILAVAILPRKSN